ncbi:MAG: hypothetical protein J6S54_00500 [Lentisphaeria bacterium]|nr:hypothetical protein [Lentisphaeria bacterium]
MKNFRRDNQENLLLLKSFFCVLLAAAAILLLLCHSSPVEEKQKFYGGGVSLLLAHTPEESSDFLRWSELNDPSRIFGYNSEGIFSASVKQKAPMAYPVLRSYIPDSFDTALYLPDVQKSEPLKIEKSSGTFSVPRGISPERKVPFVSAGIPVFDEKGHVVTRLENIPDTPKAEALLIRVGSNRAGQEFRVIESSGDRMFDRSVTGALKGLARKGKNFSGILAVWPEAGEVKK